MKSLRKIVNNGFGLNPLYLEHLEQEARVSERRKSKFCTESEIQRRRHWANRAGTYAYGRYYFGPKFWRGRKPVRVHRSIRSYQDLSEAISSIAEGVRDQHEFVNVDGLNRERLRMAQSLRDRGRTYDPKVIARADYRQLEALAVR